MHAEDVADEEVVGAGDEQRGQPRTQVVAAPPLELVEKTLRPVPLDLELEAVVEEAAQRRAPVRIDSRALAQQIVVVRAHLGGMEVIEHEPGLRRRHQRGRLARGHGVDGDHAPGPGRRAPSQLAVANVRVEHAERRGIEHHLRALGGLARRRGRRRAAPAGRRRAVTHRLEPPGLAAVADHQLALRVVARSTASTPAAVSRAATTATSRRCSTGNETTSLPNTRSSSSVSSYPSGRRGSGSASATSRPSLPPSIDVSP